MLALGHTGITLGAALILDSLRQRRLRQDNGCQEPIESMAVQKLMELSRPMDCRLLLLGSMLPDIIDKPLGTAILSDAISNGRIFSHTLVFLIALWVGGTFLFSKWGKTWGLILAFGSSTHLLLDGMWSDPRTLLWPLYGWSFAKTDISDWLLKMVYGMFTNPRLYLPDMVGAAILGYCLFSLARRQQLRVFLERGWFVSGEDRQGLRARAT